MLGSVPEETRRLPLDHMSLYKRVDYEVACNWKVYVDNYLEGYHIPMVHPGLFHELDYAAYRVETGAFHSKQHAPIRPRAEESLYRRNLEPHEPPEALYYWVFPNVMLNLYPDNLQTNVILPLSAERTVTRFEWYVLDPESPGVAEEFAQELRLQRPDAEGGHRDLRGGAAQPALPRVRARAVLRAARERRAPLPRPARALPGGGSGPLLIRPCRGSGAGRRRARRA